MSQLVYGKEKNISLAEKSLDVGVNDEKMWNFSKAWVGKIFIHRAEPGGREYAGPDGIGISVKKLDPFSVKTGRWHCAQTIEHAGLPHMESSVW